MDIGGIDVILHAKSINIDKVIAILRQYWAGGILEDDDYEGRREFFFYNSANSKELWDDEGAVEPAFNSMIYVILDKSDDLDQLTLVLDNPYDPPVAKIISDITVAIQATKSKMFD